MGNLRAARVLPAGVDVTTVRVVDVPIARDLQETAYLVSYQNKVQHYIAQVMELATAHMSEPRTSRGHEERDARLDNFVEITLEMLCNEQMA